MSNKEKIEELEEKRTLIQNEMNEKLGKITKELLKEHVKQFVQEHALDFKDNEQNIPVSIRLSYIDEYNDEGGTDPYIDDVYMYDEIGDMIDLDFEIETKSSYSNDTWNEEIQEILRELLYDCFDVEDLEKYIGTEKVTF